MISSSVSRDRPGDGMIVTPRSLATVPPETPALDEVFCDSCMSCMPKLSYSCMVLDQFEIAALRVIRTHAAHPVTVGVARLIGIFGEHAIGWVALGALLAVLYPHDRPLWFSVILAAVAAHGAGILIKQVVKRRRPAADDLPALCRTPGPLSFPSAHACSTTAASIMLIPILSLPLAAGIIGVTAFSRLLLGVHYPTDVLAGMAVGAAVAAIVMHIAIIH